MDSFVVQDDNLSYAAWVAILLEADSPIIEDGVEAYEAAKPYAAMCLAMMQGSTRLGTAYTEVSEAHNPFLFINEGSFGGLRYFESWTDAITEWNTNYLRVIAETPDHSLWQLAAQAIAYVDADTQGLYDLAVPDYLNDQGEPFREVLIKWFDFPISNDATERVFALWLSWCARFQVYPSCLEVSNVGQKGTQYTFSNGLRIFDSGYKARVLGAGQI